MGRVWRGGSVNFKLREIPASAVLGLPRQQTCANSTMNDDNFLQESTARNFTAYTITTPGIGRLSSSEIHLSPSDGFARLVYTHREGRVSLFGLSVKERVQPTRVLLPDDIGNSVKYLVVPTTIGQHYVSNGGNGRFWILCPSTSLRHHDTGPISGFYEKTSDLVLYARPEEESVVEVIEDEEADDDETEHTTKRSRTEPPTPQAASSSSADLRRSEQRMCMICTDRPPNTLVTPCMCSVVCSACSPKLRYIRNSRDRCCGCRQRIDAIYTDNEAPEMVNRQGNRD